MLKKVILHLGSPKAGSSSIQQSLFGYDDGRSFYLNLGDSNPNHSLRISSAFMKNKVHYLWKRREISDQEIISTNNKTIKILDDSLKRTDREEMIISGEGIGFSLDNDELGELINYLQKYGAKLNIFYYARDPLSFAKSIFQQRAKRGGIKKLEKKYGFTRHRKRLEKFIEMLPKEQISVKEFTKSNLYKGCVVHDFCKNINIKPNNVINVNESVSLHSLKLILLLNKLVDFQKFSNKYQFQARNSLIKFLMEAYSKSESIDKEYFNCISNNSESSFLNENFNINFANENNVENKLTIDDVNNFLNDTSDINKNNLFELLLLKKIKIDTNDTLENIILNSYNSLYEEYQA